MCPLCDNGCKVWQLSETCTYAKVVQFICNSAEWCICVSVLTTAYVYLQVNLLFDNNGTVLFAMFMAVWGEFYLPML